MRSLFSKNFKGIFFLLLGSRFLFADPAIQVSAELSRHRVAAGEMVQLDVKVTGAQEADVPHEITVDGLQIRLAGQSTQMQMVNFSVSSSALYSYIIMPLRSGTFTIPAIQVRADGKYFRTSPQQLTIEGAAPASTSSARSPIAPSAAGMATAVQGTSATASRTTSTVPENQLAFSELLIPKKKLYVGEVVPAEIRFYVNARYNAAPRRGIDFSNEGLLVERLSEPQSSTQERNGIPYNVATFHTFISAVKPGTLSVGPAMLDIVLELPTSAPANMPDVVAQLLGRSGGMMQQRPLTLKSNKVSLEIMALPSEGCPENFSGAIGDFQMDAMALPKKYSMGDPVTLAITIEGQGNFKSINMPELTETKGWKIYPSTDRIDAPDAAGLHGIKTFETTMMAQEPRTTTPTAIFSYFNPNTGKYVTLSTKPLSLQVIPSASSAATPAAATPVVAAPTPAASAAPASPALPHDSMRSWRPLWCQKEYLIATGILLCAWLLLLFYWSFQRYQKTEALVQQQQLKKWWLELQDEQLEPELFFHKATLYAEALLKKDPSRFAELEEIFKRRDEIQYGARESVLRVPERQKILEKLTLVNELIQGKKTTEKN